MTIAIGAVRAAAPATPTPAALRPPAAPSASPAPAPAVPWRPGMGYAGIDQGRLSVTYLGDNGKHTTRTYALRTLENGAGTWYPATLTELVKTNERWLRSPRSRYRADVVTYEPNQPDQAYWFTGAWVQPMRRRADGGFELVPGSRITRLDVGNPKGPVVLDVRYEPADGSTPLAAVSTAADTVEVPHRRGAAAVDDARSSARRAYTARSLSGAVKHAADVRQAWSMEDNLGRLDVRYQGPSGALRTTSYRLVLPEALQAVAVPARTRADAIEWAQRYLADGPGSYAPHVLARGRGRYWLTPAYTQRVDVDGGFFGGDKRIGEKHAGDFGAARGPKVASVGFNPTHQAGIVAVVTEQGAFPLTSS